MKPSANHKQRGQVFVIVAVSLVMLIGAAGLAIDSAMGYLLRAKLNAAVDAAAVAGARSASLGRTWAEQEQEAVAAARKFFESNYPQGYLGSNREITDIRVTLNYPARGQICVEVHARADVPATFMRIMGIEQVSVSANAKTVRKDLDLAFVVDTSGSMAPVQAEVRRQAAAFLDRLSPASDRVSLIHFSTGAEVDRPIRLGNQRGFDRAEMAADINGFQFRGLTNSAEGFWHAREQLNRIAPGQRSSMRVIVFFSDGSPNTFASHFRFRHPGQCNRAGAISSNDSPTGTPSGLWDHQSQEVPAWGACWHHWDISSQLHPQGLPEWYNAHDAGHQEFPVVTAGPRPVTNDTSTPAITYQNVNRASKNLAEAMAARARAEGIHVLTLGLGNNLRLPTGAAVGADDTGENLLKCMANTEDAPARCRAAGAGQPVGIYCHAATVADIQPCFASLASQILRITR